MNIFEAYKITILISGLTGLLLLIQIIIADILAIKTKHTPGYPISPNHNNFLFRAARAHNNTNESIAIFALFTLFGILSESNPSYLNAFSVVYFVSRFMHMICYYANFKLARSISFPLSLAGLMGMFISGLITWL